MCPFINLRSKLEFMHVDARELDNNTLIEGDLCIVGAGAAGISMALDWNKSGKKVILLEGGGFEYDSERTGQLFERLPYIKEADIFTDYQRGGVSAGRVFYQWFYPILFFCLAPLTTNSN